MRILEISPFNHVVGGSDRYFMEVARLLERAGHGVHRFCRRHPRNEPSPDSAFFVRGIDTQRGGVSDALTMIYSRDAARSLEALLRAHPVDIAHLHIYYGNFSGSILPVLRRTGTPAVQTVHEYKAVCPVSIFHRDGAICEDCDGGHFWRALRHRCNRGSVARSALSMTEAYVTDALGARTAMDRYIAVCHFQAERLVAHGLPADRTEVLHNFVDTRDFPQVVRDGPPDSIVYFGRIERVKGVDMLLDAFLALPAETRRGIRLRFAGSGGYADGLRARIQAEADASVEYLGFVDGAATEALFNSALCTVLVPNWYENCPMSVLESYARGVPVVASRIGGLPEIVADGEDGLIVGSGNTAELSAALATMISDPQRAVSMGERGRARMQRDFSPEGHVARLTAIFEDVLARRDRGTASP